MWFVRRFGPDVNLGNIAADDVLSLETLRLGLRSDTARRRAAGELGARADGVLLARHGETDDNLEPIRVQGFTRHAAERHRPRARRAELAERVAAEGIASLWSSDLSRGARDGRDRRRRGSASSRGSTRGCARPTAASWEGRPVRRHRARGARALRRLAARRRRRSASPAASRCASSRTASAAALDEIHAAGELPALVVCHGGSIRVMLCRRDPRGLDAFHEFEVPNVAVVRAVSRLPVVAFAALVVGDRGGVLRHPAPEGHDAADRRLPGARSPS